MQKTAISMLMLATFGISNAALAAGQMKPGLWEMTIKSDAMKNMPKIPPEQLEMMKKHGVTLPSAGGITQKVCMTKEAVERDESEALTRNQSGCQSKNMQRSGGSFSADIVCDGPEMKGTGKVKGTYAGSEGYSSTYSFKGTSHGQPVDMTQETSGKWLSADCGSVKPVEPPKKK
jgi:hypothetical protein